MRRKANVINFQKPKNKNGTNDKDERDFKEKGIPRAAHPKNSGSTHSMPTQ